MRDRQACRQLHSALAAASPDLLPLLNRALSEGYAVGEEEGYHTGSGDNPSGIVNRDRQRRRHPQAQLRLRDPVTRGNRRPAPGHGTPNESLVQLTHCRDHPERWHADLRLDPEAGHVRLTLCSDPALLRERMQDLQAQAEAAAHELLISQRDAPRDQFSR